VAISKLQKSEILNNSPCWRRFVRQLADHNVVICVLFCKNKQYLSLPGNEINAKVRIENPAPAAVD